MQRAALQDILGRVSASDATSIVITLNNGLFLSVDTIVRYEQDYLVMRGREGGTTDEGRAFFIPYDEIGFVKIDRMVKASELKRMYGETVSDDPDELMTAEKTPDKAPSNPVLTPKIDATDPAGIAKQNLLARIRAARTSTSGGSTGK